MKHMAIVFALVLTACAAPVAVQAQEVRAAGSPPAASVFPVPRDPWRSWGVQRDPPPLRHDLPRHLAAPRTHGRVVAGREPVWMPEQWIWDGAAWVWWPGGWVR